jgi:chromosome condensin MukBEF ATPase and DNA-binding subunit MukB
MLTAQKTKSEKPLYNHLITISNIYVPIQFLATANSQGGPLENP